MSSSDFRQITLKTDARRAEKLFRAAVSAFCSLTRPTRREIAQLEDLTLPLFDLVSVEARRYVAAALSECMAAPAALVKRLCDEPVEIAAPLLIRSAALADIDQLALIGRHGYPHAKAIARRSDLNPVIAELVAALERSAGATPILKAEPMPDVFAVPAATPRRPETPDLPRAVQSADDVRASLRAMMLPSGRVADIVAPEGDDRLFERLRDTALSGHPAFLQTALADALAIDFDAAAEMTRGPSYAWLLAGLRALNLTEEQAFLVTAAAFPAELSSAETIRLFLLRFRLLHKDVALDRVRRSATARLKDRAKPLPHKAANGADNAPADSGRATAARPR